MTITSARTANATGVCGRLSPSITSCTPAACRWEASWERRHFAELEQSITEAETEEEQKAVEEAVDAFEEEKKTHSEQTAALEQEIAAMEQQISEAEEKQRAAAVQYEKRGNNSVKANYKTNFFGMSVQERDAFFADTRVKNFLSEVRALRAQHGSISGAELTIPDVMLDLLREAILKYSKLVKYTHKVNMSGKARQTIMGSVPEAVWTEACGKINELNLLFNNAEVDSYKVGGFFAVCNPILEDSDIDLASMLISALGQSIGYALDKATLYGTGKKMPLGIVTKAYDAVLTVMLEAAGREITREGITLTDDDYMRRPTAYFNQKSAF